MLVLILSKMDHPQDAAPHQMFTKLHPALKKTKKKKRFMNLGEHIGSKFVISGLN